MQWLAGSGRSAASSEARASARAAPGGAAISQVAAYTWQTSALLGTADMPLGASRLSESPVPAAGMAQARPSVQV